MRFFMVMMLLAATAVAGDPIGVVQTKPGSYRPARAGEVAAFPSDVVVEGRLDGLRTVTEVDAETVVLTEEYVRGGLFVCESDTEVSLPPAVKGSRVTFINKTAGSYIKVTPSGTDTIVRANGQPLPAGDPIYSKGTAGDRGTITCVADGKWMVTSENTEWGTGEVVWAPSHPKYYVYGWLVSEKSDESTAVFNRELLRLAELGETMLPTSGTLQGHLTASPETKIEFQVWYMDRLLGYWMGREPLQETDKQLWYANHKIQITERMATMDTAMKAVRPSFFMGSGDDWQAVLTDNGAAIDQ